MFGRRTFLEPHIEDWQLQTWRWLLDSLGGQAALDQRALVVPTGAFFPKSEAVGHARALEALHHVKRHMGLEDWPCRLEPHERRPMMGDNPVFGLQSTRGALGTYRRDDAGAVITYDPDLVKRPHALIATFAHECAHYTLDRINRLPPGAEEEPKLEELATDLAVAFHGFGIFGANAAFEFEQFQSGGTHGWRSSTSGYLTEDSWVFAIAVFLALRGERPDDARQWLKPQLTKRLDKAVARLAREPQLLAALG